MAGEQEGVVPQKRLGDLLIESGLITPDDLLRGLEYSKKTALPLGRVLVMLHCATEEDLKHVVQVQSLMRFEGLTGAFAVLALRAARERHVSMDDTLKALGWEPDRFKGQEPEELLCLRDAIATIEEHCGPQDERLIEAYGELGDFYNENEVYGQAESCYEKARYLAEKKLGLVNYQTVTMLWKLAGLYFMQERFSEAAPLYERIAEGKKQLLGEKHEEVARALHDLAEVYDVQGRYTEAERYYLQCIVVHESLAEQDEDAWLEHLRRLAYVSRRVSRGADPVFVGELLRAAGILDEETLAAGLEHSRQVRVPVGRALVLLGCLKEEDLQVVLHAQMMIKNGLMSLALGERLVRYAAEHGLSLEATLEIIGWPAKEIGRARGLPELMAASDELVEMEKRLPGDHPDLIAACMKVADLYCVQYKYAEAEMFYRRALMIQEKVLGPEHLNLAATLDKMAEVYELLEKHAEVEPHYRRALTIREKNLGTEHIDLAISYEHLAAFCNIHKKYDEAVSWFDLSVNLRERLLGSTDESLGDVLEAMANCCFDGGDYSRAEPLYMRAYNVKKRVMREDDPRLVAILSKLTGIYGREDWNVSLL